MMRCPLELVERVSARWNFALFSALGPPLLRFGGYSRLQSPWVFCVLYFFPLFRIIQARKENRLIFPPNDPERTISVLIPAFNEEAVIEALYPAYPSQR